MQLAIVIFGFLGALTTAIFWWMKSRTQKAQLDEALDTRQDANDKTSKMWQDLNKGDIDKVETEINQLNSDLDTISRVLPPKS